MMHASTPKPTCHACLHARADVPPVCASSSDICPSQPCIPYESSNVQQTLQILHPTPGCGGASRQMRMTFTGERCYGAAPSGSIAAGIRWLSAAPADPADNAGACTITRATGGSATDQLFNKNYLGSCGVPPARVQYLAWSECARPPPPPPPPPPSPPPPRQRTQLPRGVCCGTAPLRYVCHDACRTSSSALSLLCTRTQCLFKKAARRCRLAFAGSWWVPVAPAPAQYACLHAWGWLLLPDCTQQVPAAVLMRMARRRWRRMRAVRTASCSRCRKCSRLRWWSWTLVLIVHTQTSTSHSAGRLSASAAQTPRGTLAALTALDMARTWQVGSGRACSLGAARVCC